VAFVAMPFGVRSSEINEPNVPTEIDFDAIWIKAIAPALEELGYIAVRADEQSGSVIVKEMLEQLVYADLVIADISISNANVYYEAGVRHVAKEKGCVVIGAEWAQPVFDLGQIRQIRYEYGLDGKEDGNLKKLKSILVEGIQKFALSRTPIYELTDYPDPLSAERISSFLTLAKQTSSFQKKLRAARLKSGEASVQATIDLVNEFQQEAQALDSAAIELLVLVRDRLGWKELLSFIDILSPETKELTFVQEQALLAQAEVGEVEESIASLEYLVAHFGGTPERYGLLGGRYKRLFYEGSSDDRDYNLEQAIDSYQSGMDLDLNEYYCACNLPRLLKSRNASGDLKRANFISNLVIEICELRLNTNKADGWEKPTLLGAAFDAEDIDKAQELVSQINRTTHEEWYLKTTVKDLKHSLSLYESKEKQEQFKKLVDAAESFL